ncbi:hypothetical protein [Enterobacter phage vB_EclS_AS5]
MWESSWSDDAVFALQKTPFCYFLFTLVSSCYRKYGGVVCSRFSRDENKKNFQSPYKQLIKSIVYFIYVMFVFTTLYLFHMVWCGYGILLLVVLVNL